MVKTEAVVKIIDVAGADTGGGGRQDLRTPPPEISE